MKTLPMVPRFHRIVLLALVFFLFTPQGATGKDLCCKFSTHSTSPFGALSVEATPFQAAPYATYYVLAITNASTTVLEIAGDSSYSAYESWTVYDSAALRVGSLNLTQIRPDHGPNPVLNGLSLLYPNRGFHLTVGTPAISGLPVAPNSLHWGNGDSQYLVRRVYAPYSGYGNGGPIPVVDAYDAATGRQLDCKKLTPAPTSDHSGLIKSLENGRNGIPPLPGPDGVIYTYRIPPDLPFTDGEYLVARVDSADFGPVVFEWDEIPLTVDFNHVTRASSYDPVQSLYGSVLTDGTQPYGCLVGKEIHGVRWCNEVPLALAKLQTSEGHRKGYFVFGPDTLAPCVAKAQAKGVPLNFNPLHKGLGLHYAIFRDKGDVRNPNSFSRAPVCPNDSLREATPACAASTKIVAPIGQQCSNARFVKDACGHPWIRDALVRACGAIGLRLAIGTEQGPGKIPRHHGKNEGHRWQ